MLLQVFIRLVDHQIILQALALEFVQIDHQGSSVLQGEPHPFLLGGWRGWRRLRMKDRRYRHGRLGEGEIRFTGPAAD